ncbi:MAG: Asp-tRNA(Asn) amidotransferase GatCAB subunit C [Euryarchaeota archaeon]|nr:Asp-tRNA(Asn) amidotransferase GatCAB subunit C [Euryarchaeota archaeon]
MSRAEVVREAERVLQELAKHLEEIELEETYHVIEAEGVREDSAPERDSSFSEAALSIAPRRDGRYYVAEAGAWV